MNKYLMMLLMTLVGLYTQAENYKLDTAHTEIGFSVKHLLISNVKGRFGKFNGTFEYNKESKSLKNLVIEIDPATISTKKTVMSI